MTVATAPVEGRAVCDARAARCRCHKTAGHVEAGDPVHACPPDRCTGSWSGDFDAGPEGFAVVTLPYPVGDPTPWDIP